MPPGSGKRNNNRLVAYIKQMRESSSNGLTPLPNGSGVNTGRMSGGGIAAGLPNIDFSYLKPVKNPNLMNEFLSRAGIPTKPLFNDAIARPQSASSFDRIPAIRRDINEGTFNPNAPQEQPTGGGGLPQSIMDLLGSNGPVGGGGGFQPQAPLEFDMAALRAEAIKRVEAMLNPQLAALSAQATEARGNTREATSDLDVIYDALGQELTNSAASTSRDLARNKAQTRQGFDQTIAQTNKSYQGASDALVQSILANGGDAATVAATVGKELTADQKFIDALTRGDRAFADSQANDLASQMSGFNQQVIGQAGATGAGKIAEAGDDLQTLLREIGGKKTEVSGQRGQLIEDMISQLMASQQEAWDADLDRQAKQQQMYNASQQLGMDQQRLDFTRAGAVDDSLGAALQRQLQEQQIQQNTYENPLEIQERQLGIARGEQGMELSKAQLMKIQRELQTGLTGKPAAAPKGYESAMQYLSEAAGSAAPQYQGALNEFFTGGNYDPKDPGSAMQKLSKLAAEKNLDINVMVRAYMKFNNA